MSERAFWSRERVRGMRASGQGSIACLVDGEPVSDIVDECAALEHLHVLRMRIWVALV